MPSQLRPSDEQTGARENRHENERGLEHATSVMPRPAVASPHQDEPERLRPRGTAAGTHVRSVRTSERTGWLIRPIRVRHAWSHAFELGRAFAVKGES
jgi:hypothetical protein